MPHQGGQTSKVSIDLSNINRQLKSGKTRGANPRELTQDELESLERRRDELKAQMREAAAERLTSQVNAHTSSEIDRAIAATNALKDDIVSAVTAQLQERPRAAAADETPKMTTMKRAMKYNVGDLRGFLEDNGARAAGRKEDVAEALAQQFTIDQLEDYMRRRGPVPKRQRTAKSDAKDGKQKKGERRQRCGEYLCRLDGRHRKQRALVSSKYAV